MKIDKSLIVEALASSTNPNYSHPLLDITDGRGTLVASDGRGLVAHPVMLCPGDVPGPVPCAALVAARKLARKGSFLTLDLSSSERVALPDGTTMPRRSIKLAALHGAAAGTETQAVLMLFKID